MEKTDISSMDMEELQNYMELLGKSLSGQAGVPVDSRKAGGSF